MTSDEIIAVIDALCEKLGLAVDSVTELVPELARWRIATCAFGVMIGLLGCGLLAAMALWSYRKAVKLAAQYNADCKKPYQDKCSWADMDGWNVLIFASASGAVVMTIIALGNGYNLLGWLTAPSMKAIEYLMELMG